jgi:ABC-type nitrate/sulfonate/bicarbonate transport system substrate-binding protein
MERIRIKPAGWLALIFLGIFVIVGLWRKPGGHKLKLGRPLRVGIEVWPGYAAGIYANGGFDPNEKSLFYKDCGLLVDFDILRADDASRDAAFTPRTPDGKPNPKSFDVIWSTIDFAAYELPRLRKKDPSINPKVFLQLDWSRGADAIVVDEQIQRLAALKGKTVSLDSHGPSVWLLASALNTQGLTTADVTLDDTKDPQKAEEKFIAGKVNAAVLWEPYITSALARRPKSHRLLSTMSAANLIADVLVARQDFIEEDRRRGDGKPDSCCVLEDFCKCWLKAVQDITQRPDIAVQPLMQGYETGLKAEHTGANSPFKTKNETRDMLDRVALAGPAENAELFGLIRKKEHPLFDIIFTKALKLMSDDSTFDPEDAKDTSIVESLLSPRPRAIRCQGTENRLRVISTDFPLDGGGGILDDQLNSLADTAQTYSHACISLEGPRAVKIKSSLIQNYNLGAERFVIKSGARRDLGSIYVLADTELEDSAPRARHGDDDKELRRAQR